MQAKIPSDTALKNRSRTLVEQMTKRTRWVYAIPPEEAERHLAAVLADNGYLPASPDVWGAPGGSMVRVVRELGVVLLEVTGEEGMVALAGILDKTGYYAQSTLLRTAWDLSDEECTEALATLARMVSSWDADWLALFEMHLLADDEEVRRPGRASLQTAVEGAGESARARELLAASSARKMTSDDDRGRAL